MTEKFEEYQQLLNLNYDDAVQQLLTKYGAVPADYFVEKSYQRYMNNEIKTPAKNGKVNSRTNDGLEIHHIMENQYEDMGNPVAIQKQNIPFEFQKAQTLCYVDKWEHTILHALIAIETKGKHGLPGLNTYLIPTIEDWYIDGNVPDSSSPRTQWIVNCYDKAKLDKEEAEALLNSIKNKLDDKLKNVQF